MKKTFEVVILNQKFSIKSDSDEKHVKKVTDYVNKRMHEIQTGNRSMASLNVAILSAMNIADEYVKYREKASGQLKGWVDRIKELVGRLA